MAMPTKLKLYLISILHFWSIGVRSPTAISRKTRINISTVKYNLKKLKESGNLDRRAGGGQKRKIKGGDAIAIGQYLKRNKEFTVKDISMKLEEKRGLKVSPMTVWRHLKRSGYMSVLPKATPMLTEDHKRRRVEWAQRNLDTDWSRVVFSDETSYQLFRNTVRRWSKQAKDERKRVPKDRKKIHVWGAFSAKGLVGIHFFTKIMDAQYYISILKNHLCGANKQFGDHWTLQQDNDPKHTAKVTQKYFSDHRINVMDWPSNSPDLNLVMNKSPKVSFFH